MSNLRTICGPNAVFTFFICCRHQARFSSRVSFQRNPNHSPSLSPASSSDFARLNRSESWFRANQRRSMVRASNWTHPKSPYETLELEMDADDDLIKVAYRRLAKFYHPDVYDGRGTLEEGETAEARFIKIQAAYELLLDVEKRGQYDRDNRVNPLKASEAWMAWLMKKRKAFDQRGDMAIAAWAEQQQREMNIRARRLSRSKVDPDEEKKILAREKKASAEYFSNTLKRHTLVLKKRDLMRRKAEEDKRKIIGQLLAAEGLELDTDDEENRFRGKVALSMVEQAAKPLAATSQSLGSRFYSWKDGEDRPAVLINGYTWLPFCLAMSNFAAGESSCYRQTEDKEEGVSW